MIFFVQFEAFMLPHLSKKASILKLAFLNVDYNRLYSRKSQKARYAIVATTGRAHLFYVKVVMVHLTIILTSYEQ